jgi:hypothetical protein
MRKLSPVRGLSTGYEWGSRERDRSGESNRISQPSHLAGQSRHSMAIAQGDGQQTLDPNQPKLLIEFLSVDDVERVLHSSFLLYLVTLES